MSRLCNEYCSIVLRNDSYHYVIQIQYMGSECDTGTRKGFYTSNSRDYIAIIEIHSVSSKYNKSFNPRPFYRVIKNLVPKIEGRFRRSINI